MPDSTSIFTIVGSINLLHIPFISIASMLAFLLDLLIYVFIFSSLKLYTFEHTILTLYISYLAINLVQTQKSLLHSEKYSLSPNLLYLFVTLETSIQYELWGLLFLLDSFIYHLEVIIKPTIWFAKHWINFY